MTMCMIPTTSFAANSMTVEMGNGSIITISANSTRKKKDYIKETEKWVYPLFDKAKTMCPEYCKQIFIIQYQMLSVITSVREFL